ncbi:M56 family metallopeptidase [Frateuria defendens]|uniref:M56 family metallopeptidase n=1 Tax=Frateuria defendens TaxID=2219559 RepID=UPI0007DBFD2D|nr:M56 family metallopeptidase [Frateuria defendens]
MATLDQLSSLLLTRLAWSSLQAAVLVGVVALLVRRLPRLPAAVGAMLWWLVALQGVVGLGWHAPLALPLLAPASAPTAASPAGTEPPMRADAMAVGMPSRPTTAAPTASVPASPPRASAATERMARPSFAPADHWRTALAALWLLGVLAPLPLWLRQGWRTHRLLCEAAPVADPRLRAQCMAQAKALGLRRCPALRASPTIRSPQVAGLWRPTVLWPAASALSAEESAMALAHELAHLRRGDLWLGWLPAIAQRLFFFHPLVAWAAREYALHREAACDALATRELRAAPQDYGRLLLRLGVARPLHAGLAGASPTFRNLKRRLTMLQQTNETPRARGWVLVALVALAGVLPYRLTAAPEPAATAAPAVAATAQANPVPRAAGTPAASPRPAATAARATPASRATYTDDTLNRPPPPPAPLPPPPLAAPPAPPAPPSPPAPLPARGLAGHHVDIDVYTDAERGFALFDGDTVMVHGDEHDLAQARAWHEHDAPLLWLRRDGRAYVVRDAAFVRHARDLYAPLTELSKQQGQLASQQGALAGRQGGLAAREGALASRRAELEGRRAAVEAERATMQARPDPTSHTAASAATDAKAKVIAEQLAALAQARTGLDGEQAKLAQQQAALSLQQAELSRHQRNLSAQLGKQMDRLLDEALAKGLAQPAAR